MSYKGTDIFHTGGLFKAAKINQLPLFVEIAFSNYVFSKNINNTSDVICFLEFSMTEKSLLISAETSRIFLRKKCKSDEHYRKFGLYTN